jgi:hypothetical protein
MFKLYNYCCAAVFWKLWHRQIAEFPLGLARVDIRRCNGCTHKTLTTEYLEQRYKTVTDQVTTINSHIYDRYKTVTIQVTTVTKPLQIRCVPLQQEES